MLTVVQIVVSRFVGKNKSKSYVNSINYTLLTYLIFDEFVMSLPFAKFQIIIG
jgi:hypothetical protein